MKQYVFSNLMVVMKKYSKNPRQSYQFYMTDLFNSLGCNCVNYERNLLPTNTSSRIMTRAYDVPKDVRCIINDYSNEQIDKFLKAYITEYMNINRFESLINELKNFIMQATNLTDGEKERLCSFTVPAIMIREALICAIRIDNRLRLNDEVWSNGVNSINLVSGDIIALSFNKKECINEKIVVIPVDSDFHLHISGASEEKPEVSKTTLHGQWLMRMEKEGFTIEDIRRMINESIINSDSIGSISKLVYKSVIFYLVGLSKFDDNNIAHSDKNAISKCVINILNEYNKTGQGVPLYIPLMGTGRSRIGLSNEEAIDLLIEECKKNKEKIQGTVNVLVYIKDLEKIMEVVHEL